jgi:HEAT repeat protein
MNNVEGRRLQEKFIPLAAQNVNLLRRVLQESADAENRALAAEIIAYYPDKTAIIDDLVYALKDSDGTVRNNAMRALALIAGHGYANPEKRITVPFSPFVDLLNSVEWSDRNKSALAISELTEKRNPELLSLLRQKAVPSLIEMARWKNEGHAGMPFVILGRVAGFSEDEIVRALITGNRETLILRAEKILLKKH